LRRASIRRLALAVAAGLVLISGACAKLRAVADPGASPSPLSFEWPAASKGVACGLVDFGEVGQALGTTFDTAAGAQVADSYTCVETRSGQGLPNLSVAVSPTVADDLIFTVSVAPAGATTVVGLGQAAYVVAAPAAGSNGPAIEYGWLSAKPRLYILRYTFPPGADAAAVTAMTPKLLILAKWIESATL
jgi:hypothetical protein